MQMHMIQLRDHTGALVDQRSTDLPQHQARALVDRIEMSLDDRPVRCYLANMSGMLVHAGGAPFPHPDMRR
jgi:hypothetical protein